LDYYGLMSLITRLTTVTLLWVFASGVALGAVAEPEVESVKNSNLSSEIFYQILVGEISAQNADAASAYALMLDAARKTNAPQLYERAIQLALMARSGESALQATQAWVRAIPASREANRYLLQILIGLNRTSEILEPLKRELVGLAPNERVQAITQLPRYFARATDKAAAVRLVEQALSADFSNAFTGAVAWSTLGLLQLAANDANGALEAARRGAAVNPKAEEPIILALTLTGPQADAAEALIQKHLEGNASADLRMAYTRKLLDAQRSQQAYAQMQRLNTEKPAFADAWLIRGSLEAQDNKNAEARSSLQTYLALAQSEDPQTARGMVQAYIMLSQLAEQDQKLEEANAYLLRIESPQDKLRVDARRAILLARLGKIEEARTLIRNIPVLQAEDARAKITLEVQLLRDYKRLPEAYQVLEEAVALNPNDMDLVYDQAMLAEKMGKLVEMEAMLRRVIATKPDYHHAYNALGYAFADRNIHLAEARQLIQKALEFAPADPYIIDSLAWVEFRSGNTTKAIELLQSAFKTKPDAEIAAHLGEVLWVSGQKSLANEVWKQGQALNAENEALIETIKRLNPKL
jgi:tetratricopeptide (TPR) repeat protein